MRQISGFLFLLKSLFILGQLLTYVTGSVQASEAVTVLGLPLGGKMKPVPGNCRDFSPRKGGEQSICWIYSVRGDNGSKHSALHMPSADSRPSWAAYAEFEAEVSKDGTLNQFTVVSSAKTARDITDSISTRFGKPSYSVLKPSFEWSALWDSPEIEISTLCDFKNCQTRFRSAKVAAAERAKQKERTKVDAARPISP